MLSCCCREEHRQYTPQPSECIGTYYSIFFYPVYKLIVAKIFGKIENNDALVWLIFYYSLFLHFNIMYIIQLIMLCPNETSKTKC